jgi:hypothetical protein
VLGEGAPQVPADDVIHRLKAALPGGGGDGGVRFWCCFRWVQTRIGGEPKAGKFRRKRWQGCEFTPPQDAPQEPTMQRCSAEPRGAASSAAYSLQPHSGASSGTLLPLDQGTLCIASNSAAWLARDASRCAAMGAEEDRGEGSEGVACGESRLRQVSSTLGRADLTHLIDWHGRQVTAAAMPATGVRRQPRQPCMTIRPYLINGCCRRLPRRCRCPRRSPRHCLQRRRHRRSHRATALSRCHRGFLQPTGCPRAADAPASSPAAAAAAADAASARWSQESCCCGGRRDPPSGSAGVAVSRCFWRTTGTAAASPEGRAAAREGGVGFERGGKRLLVDALQD